MARIPGWWLSWLEGRNYRGVRGSLSALGHLSRAAIYVRGNSRGAGILPSASPSLCAIAPVLFP